MIPIVQVAPPSEGEPEEGRKRRQLEWNEARLSLARAKGCVTPRFAATLGGPDDARDQLKHCAVQAGMGKNTAVHCVWGTAPRGSPIRQNGSLARRGPLALRVNRANEAWNDYWSQQELKQAT